MNKKIIAGVLAASFIATSVGISYADFGGNSHSSKASLTVEEKASLETMTKEEKKVFMNEKRTVEMEKRLVKESVIDALLAGTSLTSEQEVVRAEIITQRAEKKANMEARKAQMEELKPIMEKKKAGEELTVDEQAKLDAAKETFGKKGFHKGFKKGFNKSEKSKDDSGNRGNRGKRGDRK